MPDLQLLYDDEVEATILLATFDPMPEREDYASYDEWHEARELWSLRRGRERVTEEKVTLSSGKVVTVPW